MALRAILLLFLFITSTCFAKTELNLVSATFTDIVEQKDGELEGLAVELTKRISEKLNTPISIQVLPFSRAIKYAEEGKVDGFVGAYFSEERSQYLHYLMTPIYTDSINFITLSESKYKFKGNYDDLQKSVIGILRKGAYHPKISDLNTIEVGSSEQQFGMLSKGRVDLIINNPRTTRVLVKSLGMQDDIQIHQPAVHQQSGYFAFKQDLADSNLIKRFNAALLELEKNGELAALRDQYLAR